MEYKSNGRVPADAKLYTADWGGGYWYIHDGENDTKLKKAEFASMEWIDAGSYLVVEYAHIQVPRKKESLAQVYTGEELVDLYDAAIDAGVQCLWFPQHLTSRVRAIAGLNANKGTGEDADDARALHRFVRSEPVVLHKPRYNFDVSPSRQAIYDFKSETNAILNWARSQKGYETQSDEYFSFGTKEDACRQLLRDANICAFGKPKDRYNKVGQETYDKDVRSVLANMGACQLYTLAALVVDPAGNERQRDDTDAMPGVNWLVRNIVGTSPFHHRGGIARSNIYYHGIRNWCVIPSGKKKPKYLPLAEFDKQQKDTFRQQRRQYMRGIRWLLRHLQATHKGEQFGLLAMMSDTGGANHER